MTGNWKGKSEVNHSLVRRARRACIVSTEPKKQKPMLQE